MATKLHVVDYFCSTDEYVWHKLRHRLGRECVANCGYSEQDKNAEITSCVFIGMRCDQCFEEDELFDVEQCGC